MTNSKISVVVLTRNRCDLLKKCLQSLSYQTKSPFEIVVVDNNSEDDTPQLIAYYQRKLPIKKYHTTIAGYPLLYNFGLEKTKGEIVAFLDDDCIAKRDWLEKIEQAHHRLPNAVIQGQTYSYPFHNIYVEVMADHYQNWLRHNTLAGNQMRVIDNKNVSAKRQIWVNHFFNKQLLSGAEDIELGRRMVRNGIKIYFDDQIVALHHERSNFKAFFQQHLRIAMSEKHLDNSLSSQEKIGTLNKKAVLNLLSMLKRAITYFQAGRFSDLVMLPIIYLVLIGTRFYGYYVHSPQTN